MKRTITIILLLITISLSINAQARFSTELLSKNLRQVEWKTPTKSEFVITNTGDKPLVITKVQTDCACTVPNWTQRPIRAGEKGIISVEFDAKLLGHFNKSIMVYCNAEPYMYRLSIRGEVVPHITDYKALGYELMGDIAIEKTELEFPDVKKGDKSTITLGVLNLSDETYEPAIMHLPPSITMKASPEVLQKGEKGKIELTLDANKIHSLGLHESSVYLSRFLGDKVCKENRLLASVVMLPDFSNVDKYTLKSAPKLSLSTNTLDFSELLKKKRKASQYVTISNTGKTSLEIKTVQVFNTSISLRLKKREVEPGKSVKLKVTVYKKRLKKNKKHLKLIIISNSPENPKEEIKIEAN